MEAALLPATFLNPLPVIAWPVEKAQAVAREAGQEVGASIEATIAALGAGTKNVAKGTANLAGKTAAQATQPIGSGMEAIGKGMSDTSAFLSVAAEKMDGVAQKFLIGELVLVGLAVLGIGATIYFANRGNKSSVTQILFGRAKPAGDGESS